MWKAWFRHSAGAARQPTYIFSDFSLPQKAIVQPTGCSASKWRANLSNTPFQNPSNPQVLQEETMTLVPTTCKIQDREGTEKGGEMGFQEWIGLIGHVQPSREQKKKKKQNKKKIPLEKSN